MNKKSPYSNAYKIGLSVFIALVIILSTIVISVFKSCEPKVSKLFTKETNMTDTIFYDGPYTIYLPNPQKIIVHDTFRVVCHKKHCEDVKVIKDTTTK